MVQTFSRLHLSSAGQLGLPGTCLWLLRPQRFLSRKIGVRWLPPRERPVEAELAMPRPRAWARKTGGGGLHGVPWDCFRFPPTVPRSEQTCEMVLCRAQMPCKSGGGFLSRTGDAASTLNEASRPRRQSRGMLTTLRLSVCGFLLCIKVAPQEGKRHQTFQFTDFSAEGSLMTSGPGAAESGAKTD